jgi:hypothetical protein
LLRIPFGVTIETIPTHLPLPAKIRTDLLDPIYLATQAPATAAVAGLRFRVIAAILLVG